MLYFYYAQAEYTSESGVIEVSSRLEKEKDFEDVRNRIYDKIASLSPDFPRDEIPEEFIIEAFYPL